MDSTIKKILIVDDEKNFISSLSDRLRKAGPGYGIMTAENGEGALKILESAQVDLVVTDLRMPVLDGFGLLSHMKRNYPHIPVIVMSAFLIPEVEARLIALGASQCIEKSNAGALEEILAQRWQEVYERR